MKKGVFTLKDFDCNVLQQSASQNGILHNITCGMREEDQRPYPFSIDFGFANRAEDVEKMELDGQT